MPARRTVPAWAPATTVVTLLLAVLTALAALPTTAVHAAQVHKSASRTDTAKADPLGVTIESLSPSSLKGNPTKGTVRVSGTITNDDTQTWQDINVHAFIGSTPLTTETELTEASLSDPTQDVGNRITTYGDFETIAALQPGQSDTYSLTIPRADLVDSDGNPITAPGVYWFGVQVLGTDTAGRDKAADGRARTFLPLVDAGKKTTPVKTAVVVPLRQRVLRQPDGTIAAPEKWVQRLSTGGRLDNVLTFAAGHPVSWLIDPAVIDAIKQLADGNPPRSIAPTDGSDTPGEAPSPSPTAKLSGDERAAADDAADIAKAWLARLIAELKSSPAVYALPYGDLDLAASARHDPGLYAVARQRSTEALTALGITNAAPIDAPINGYLQPGALNVGSSSPKLLLSDQAISGTVPAVASVSGRAVVTTSSLVAAGGPPPGDQLGLVPVRQELLAQSALRLGTDDPVIAVLPAEWNPAGDSTAFFDGLHKRWLQPTSIDGATLTSVAQEVQPTRLRYPDAELESELPRRTFAAVDGLRQSGSVLQSVLSHNNAVATTVLDDALTSASYTARGGGGGAAAERTRASIDAQLRTVTVEAPPSVTLASDRGKFNATVVNGLDQDITVKVRSVADNGMTISAPRKLDIPAHGRTGVLLTAKATTNGVHTVILRLTDTGGVPLGSQTSFPIRTAQVSRIIWLFIGCGIGLLFTAIVVRLVRRLRSGTRSADPESDTDPDASPSTPAGATTEAGVRDADTPAEPR